MMSSYLKDLQHLQSSCRLYKSMKISLEEFKSTLWTISQNIVAIDESKLRIFLMTAEAELDSIHHTTDENLIYNNCKKVVIKIEDELKNWF